jgi:cell division protein FtsB
MNIIKHSVIRIIVIVVCVFLSIGFVHSLWDTWRGSDQVGARRLVLQQAQKRHNELVNQLQEATSPAFVEKEARNKLGLVKDGETIILMGTPIAGKNQPQDSAQHSFSRWQQWWKLFF